MNHQNARETLRRYKLNIINRNGVIYHNDPAFCRRTLTVLAVNELLKKVWNRLI